MKYIVGAYATSPSISNDEAVELDFYQKLIESIPEICGLEIPFFGDEIHRFGSDFLIGILKPEWSNVLSCIPGTMANLSIDPKYGIASDDYDCRVAAVAMYKRANKIVHKMNDIKGKQSIIAIQAASAPSVPIKGVSSSKSSLLRSMEEILSLDWQGAKVVIEHCDSAMLGFPFEKGFLTFEDEIEALSQLSELQDVGVTINWGRSAIEGRTANRPIEHIKLAVEKKLLAGLIFSGASEKDQFYGGWKDTHMPFAQSYNTDYYEKNSLLTYENISDALNLLDFNNLNYLGIKLLSMPMESSKIERRIGLNKDAIFILEEIISELSLMNKSNIKRQYE
jgi:hypothetical protein